MQLAFEARNAPALPEWRDLVETKLAELAADRDDIVHGRVIITKNPHHLHGHEEVRLSLTVPGDLLTVQRNAESVEDALYQVLEVMERELKAYREQRRRAEKTSGPRPRGVVASWFPDRGYGFIRSEGDRELYFHERSVANQDRSGIALGAQVEFEIEEGEKGPQASRVALRR